MRRSLQILLAALTGLTSACAGLRGGDPRAEEGSGLYGDVMAARYATLTGDAATAAARFARAAALAPGDQELAERAVSAALAAGDVPLAAAVARRAEADGAQTSIGAITLAADALARGRERRALRLTAEPAGAPFERLVARTIQIWALVADGESEQALALVEQDRGPIAQIMGVQRALLLERLGRVDEALAAYRDVQEGGLRLPAVILRQGALLERERRREEAASLYRNAFAETGAEEIGAALARVEAGQPPPADAARRPAAAAAFGMLALSVALLSAADAETAVPFLALALALDPEQDLARLAFAEAVGDLGRAAQARLVLDAIKPNSPHFQAAQIRRAYLFAQEGRKAEAVAAAEIAAAGGAAIARRALADLLRDAERWEDAVAQYDRLIAEGADEPDWRLFFSRGAARERLGRWEGAEADLKQALALAPDQPEVLNYLGYSWIDRGVNLKEGLALIERAVELRPQSGHIVDSLGWAHYKLGDYAAALPHLERAADLAPEDPTINDHLGDLYWRLGRRVEARYQWRKAISLADGEFDVGPVEAKIAGGLTAATLEP